MLRSWLRVPLIPSLTELALARRRLLERTQVVCRECGATARVIDVVPESDVAELSKCYLTGGVSFLTTVALGLEQASVDQETASPTKRQIGGCARHRGTWILSKDAQDFMQLEESLKEQLRTQKVSHCVRLARSLHARAPAICREASPFNVSPSPHYGICRSPRLDNTTC